MPPNPLAEIIELARWAPSGDNTQPWRFEILSDSHVRVHGFDTRADCVYDVDGRPSQIALGTLLENLAIAASGFALRADINRQSDSPETAPVFDAHLSSDPTIQPDPLRDVIRERRVQRRPLSPRMLTPDQRQTLEAAAGPAFDVQWFEGWGARARIANLLFANAKLRLTMPEAYRVHRSIIAWNSRYSNDRVPDQALGLDAMTLQLMRWVMRSWERVNFFNRYLMGTWLPRIELDLLPGLFCAAHFVLIAPHPMQTLDDRVATGRALQRFWLTATQLGLQLQPELTPLVFAEYVRADRPFTQTSSVWRGAVRLTGRLERLLGPGLLPRAAFMGRVGFGQAARARSLRLKPETLLHPCQR